MNNNKSTQSTRFNVIPADSFHIYECETLEAAQALRAQLPGSRIERERS